MKLLCSLVYACVMKTSLPFATTSGVLTFLCAESMNPPLGSEYASTVDLKAPGQLRTAMHLIVASKETSVGFYALVPTHTLTRSTPHVAWNSNKALSYCCQGNVVGSN